MNDTAGPSPIVPEISVARRASLPSCTEAREDLKAYIRDERFTATCDGADWRDEAGAAVTGAAASESGAETSSGSLPASSSGTVEQN